ncbi:MAG: SNF2-related protein [Bacillota bacterium]
MLLHGSGVSEGKQRIYELYQSDVPEQDRIKFLKAEYGIGGRTVIFEDGVHGWESHNAKGIEIARGSILEPEAKVLLSWAKVQKRIGELIAAGRYISENELADAEAEEIRETQHEESEHPESPVESPQPRADYRITDDALGVGGAKTKFGFNTAAIRTLQRIEKESRLATPEEQEVLFKYVGWGGIPQAFDPDNTSWAKEYAELKTLLPEDEYTAARASTLNAHYTSPVVIKAIYQAIENMGFWTGNILEPSCGIGNFFGLLPESMQNSRLYGVEIDPLTGHIAKQLYQNASIAIQGYEHASLPDSFFDLAVGNVPFGSYKLSEKRYDKYNFYIHDHFFAKTLDKVRPGGIIAFVTSKGTMDKQNTEVRRYIAQRAELLGAIRLPDNAFYANAGTEVTTDIIFLQKRDRIVDIEPDWVQLGKTQDGVPVNQYFADHPRMMLGKMVFSERMYGNANDTACKPIEGAVLSEQLAQVIAYIHGQISEHQREQEEETETVSIPADPNVRNYSYAVVDNEVYYRRDSVMERVQLNKTAEARVKGMVRIRDCVRNLIDLQLGNVPDQEITQAQAELNDLYDAYTAEYGLLSSRANSIAFNDDDGYYLLTSLEILDDNGDLEHKADMFTMRTISQAVPIDHVDTPAEALAVSIAERAAVDLRFMSRLTGLEPEQIIHELSGVIFRNPIAANQDILDGWEIADEYLSGDVRKKLIQARSAAADNPELYGANVQALERVQPRDLEASEIDVRLGATWIPPEYIKEFMFELLRPPSYMRSNIDVFYAAFSANWNIRGKSADRNNINANVTYGTERMNAYKIIEETLNLRDVKIFDTVVDAEGTERRVLNQKQTILARQKQSAIKEKFREWIWKDSSRRKALTRLYNDRFNCIRAREYDGSHITFTGMNPELSLRPHQINAVARILYGGNTLLAHVVGAGKTAVMVAAIMEKNRLGLSNKALVTVPNHLTEQTGAEFLRFFPAAKVLVSTKKDFETANRKKFCARIATGDYDVVIIGHSQLEKIPMSKERQIRMLEDQINEILEGIDEIKRARGERFTIKEMERSRKALQVRLDKLNSTESKDDVVTFEQLGVDMLVVDEAHLFKNLAAFTKMRNVAGINTTEAKKSSDMLLKCHYISEITGNKGVLFATGTPVSNSMTELYTMQRYLQYDELRERGLQHFDAWASTFGETQTAIELAPEGTGYRMKTRFAKFYNLPELMSLFKDVADVQTADMLNLPVPRLKDGKITNVLTQASEFQREMVAALGERADKVRNGSVDPTVDNMLKITNDGRTLALDQRLMNPFLPDDPDSKVNQCVGNIYRIWEEGAEKRLTQLVFCDLSTPKGDGTFNVYDDIRQKLMAQGVPEKEVAYIHDANTDAKKDELFARVRRGDVRVLIGSTAKMGAGTNVQHKMIALHHLDCPWRPSDLEQRTGRILRQGNTNPEVEVFRYITEGTFDAYSYQLVENKQKFISQIITSKSPVRGAEDVDETALSYAEVKALAAGNPLIKEKMDLDVEVARLKLLHSNYLNQRYRLEDSLEKHFPGQIAGAKQLIASYEADLEHCRGNTLDTQGQGRDRFHMTLMDKEYTEKADAGKCLLSLCSQLKDGEPVRIGRYRGFDMWLSFNSFSREACIELRHKASHKVTLGSDVFGNITRIDNVFDNISDRLRMAHETLHTLENQFADAREEVKKPFEFEQELREKSSRLIELNEILSMDRNEETPVLDDGEPEQDEYIPNRDGYER